MYQTQLLDLASEEETTRVFKPNDNDFQNTIPKPNANRKTWISRARQAVISLSNSILSFVFVHRFFTRSTSFTPDDLLFPTEFPQDQYQLPNPTWTFRIEKGSDTNAGHSFFCKRSIIFFQDQVHKSQRKIEKEQLFCQSERLAGFLFRSQVIAAAWLRLLR